MGRENKRDLKTTLISLQVCSYVYMKPGCFASRPGNSKDNVFHINTSSRNEKRPALINFSLHIIINGMLVSFTFLRISLPELPGKRLSQSICTWIHSSNFQWSFTSILLAIKRCIQNIANNIREDNWKKSSEWLLF